MYDKLRAMLAEGETLLWSGHPASFDTMDRTNRKGIIVGFIVKAIFASGATMMYLRVARNTDAGIKPSVIAFIILIAAFAFAYPFLTDCLSPNLHLHNFPFAAILRFLTAKSRKKPQKARK